LSAVPVDRLNFEGDDTIYIRAAFDHLAGKWFQHEVNSGPGVGLAQVPQKGHGQHRIANEAVPHDEYFFGL
jgi:hypothetical protein